MNKHYTVNIYIFYLFQVRTELKSNKFEEENEKRGSHFYLNVIVYFSHNIIPYCTRVTQFIWGHLSIYNSMSARYFPIYLRLFFLLFKCVNKIDVVFVYTFSYVLSRLRM